MGKNREIQIQSAQENLVEVERFVEEISDRYHLNDSYFANIQLALTEAVNNAIVHGNGSDLSKNVNIQFSPDEKGLSFKVIDHGAGFNYKNSNDPQEMLQDELRGGRGLLLIHMLADEVKFSNKGRSIEMIFKVKGIDMETMERRAEMMQNYFDGVPTELVEKQKQDE